ncbi:VOC family protein [Dyella monticola]|uniref:VOC family protein n=1 Tax=Dyella monticola TaxID=1927958 RepID=A0A370X1I9_9GAMM|nr:VOC family protein [Dyella monticola]RDS82269.1 VOC family protein [Dyella monticola]
MRLLLAFILLFGICQPAITATPAPATQSELDHVLLWGQSIDQVTAIMAVKLGFQIRPGRDPNGVANRYVRFSDRSYIELEGITRSNATMDPGMLADQAVLHGGPGARTFGLRSSALDQARSLLQRDGFTPTPIFSASRTDPDGGGPSRPPRWRLFAFQHQPLTSNLFFIDYAPSNTTSFSHADDRVAREHPNSARELSAVWLLSATADVDRRQLERLGYAKAKPIRIPQIAARGYCVPVGGKSIFVLEPDGAGIAARALHEGGPQILGLSIGVDDLPRAKRWAERGYETTLASYRGVLGHAFLAPTRTDLGLLIEFHEMSKTVSKDACGG